MIIFTLMYESLDELLDQNIELTNFEVKILIYSLLGFIVGLYFLFY